MLEKLLAQIEHRCEELRKELPQNVWL